MKKFLLVCFSFVFVLSAWAQERVVSGKVTSTEDGSAIPGVNVLLKGTTIGTVTSADGEYKLNLPAEGGTLTFSFIGFQSQEVVIGDRTVVDVGLVTDVQQLNEVVVTGIGITREAKTLGYSVATVKSEVLNQARVTNIAAALSGKVSGLQINQTDNGINGGVRVVLRGNRSFLGNNQALVVLDGVQVSSDYLNSLNPNDIESVTVLKGANAAALYGSSASNGVLVVTTRIGKKGPPEITYNHTTQLDQVAFLPKLQERFGSNGGEGPGDDVFDLNPNFPQGQYVAYENQNYGPEFNGQLVQLGRPLLDGRVQSVTYASKYKDHLKFWDIGQTEQNDASFSAADETSHFLVSIQDVSKTGVVPKDKYRRDVVRLNGDKTYGIFKLSYKMAYTLTHGDINLTTNSGNSVYWLWMNTAMNVELTKYKDWRNNIWASPTGWYDDFYGNPYFNIDNNRSVFNRSDVLGNLELMATPTKWLNIVGRVGFTGQSFHQTDNMGPTVYDLTLANPNRYLVGQALPQGGVLPGSTSDTYFNSKRINTDLLATFSKKFNDFDVRVILGHNLFDDFGTSINVSAASLVYSDPQLYNVTYRNGNLNGGTSQARQRRVSAYADASVGWKFLNLHGSFRNDWTSLLSESNRSFSYPEVDVAFVFTDAIPSLKDNQILNFGKITASWAKVGNVSLGPYQLQTVINAGTPYSSSNGSVPVMYLGNSVVSQGLKPEFTTSKEVTLQLGLWNDRIDFKTAYYQTNTINQTVPFGVSNTTGYGSALINTGEMLVKGIEFDLGVTALTTASGFKLTVGGNFTNMLTNTPLSIYTSPTGDVLTSINVLNGGGGGSNAYALVGAQYPVVRINDWRRVGDAPGTPNPNGQVIVDPVTGLPSRNPDLSTMGQANPKIRMGLTSTASFKGVSLSVLFDYRSGNVIYNNIGSSIEFGGIGYQSATAGRERFVYPNSVIDNGDGTYTQNTNVTVNEGNYNFWQSVYNNVGSNYVTSAAFWKLRELSLGYQIPKFLLEKTKVVKSARISVIGRNLLMWRPKSNQWTDPEFSTDTSNAAGTTNLFQTPPVRTYGFNVSLTF